MSTKRQYLLEQIDDAAVVQLYADGFDALPIDQKRLIWHLYQAALAGRDIYFDQRYRHALDMRDVLEEIRVLSTDGQAAFPEALGYTYTADSAGCVTKANLLLAAGAGKHLATLKCD